MNAETKFDPLNDPKGLIFEAYRIEGIDASQCRTIFLDWALALPAETGSRPAIETLLARYEAGQMDHPMTQVLRAGLDAQDKPKRRGGWRSRSRPEQYSQQ